MFTRLNKCSIIAAIALLTACKTNPSSSDQGVHSTPDQLLGRWVSDCQIENPKKPGSKYVVASDVITDGRLESRALLFEDASCTVASKPHVREFLVALTFSGRVTETPLGNAFHVDEKLLARKHDGKHLSMGVGSTAYDIVFVEGDKLYYGRPVGLNNGRSASKRHAELITESFYTKSD